MFGVKFVQTRVNHQQNTTKSGDLPYSTTLVVIVARPLSSSVAASLLDQSSRLAAATAAWLRQWPPPAPLATLGAPRVAPQRRAFGGLRGAEIAIQSGWT